MKLTSLLLAALGAFLRSETTGALGSVDRPAPPRRTGPSRPDPRVPLEPSGPRPEARLSNLRFPLFFPPLS